MKKARLFGKADVLLIVFWGVIAAMIFITGLMDHGDGITGSKLTVTVGNEIYGEYDLDEDRTIEINDGNTCEIKDGKVRMTAADCPDGLCVKSREISKAGESIVCLPNHVILKITGNGEDGGIDSIAE